MTSPTPSNQEKPTEPLKLTRLKARCLSHGSFDPTLWPQCPSCADGKPTELRSVPQTVTKEFLRGMTEDDRYLFSKCDVCANYHRRLCSVFGDDVPVDTSIPHLHHYDPLPLSPAPALKSACCGAEIEEYEIPGDGGNSSIPVFQCRGCKHHRFSKSELTSPPPNSEGEEKEVPLIGLSIVEIVCEIDKRAPNVFPSMYLEAIENSIKSLIAKAHSQGYQAGVSDAIREVEKMENDMAERLRRINVETHNDNRLNFVNKNSLQSKLNCLRSLKSNLLSL